jgi:hypothetical protein
MAEKEKKTKNKAAKQADAKAVDMTTPTTPADETGLELTEEKVNEVIEDEVKISQKEETDEVLAEKHAEEPETEEHEEESETEEHAEEPEPVFKEDKEMVNDITNILNGLDGVSAKKIGDGDKEETDEEKTAAPHKNTTNTEEKNYYSEQFSRAWGGVMYDY